MENTLQRRPGVAFKVRWQAKTGPLVECGDETLTDPLWSRRNMMDSFTVFMGCGTVTFKPKEGMVFVDNTLAIQTEPGRFEWKRDWYNEIQVGTDKNSRPDRCLRYWGAILNTKGRHGFNFLPDGRFERVSGH